MLLLMQKLNEEKNKIIVRRKNKKFETVTQNWLKYKKNIVKKSTYYNYCYCVEKYLYPEFAGKNITRIKDYNEFIEKMSKKLGPKTVKDIISKLKEIIRYYEEENNTKLKIRKMSIPKTKKKEIEILSKKEIEQLEKYCLKENSLTALGIIICLNTGLRIGEICALKWENIDFEKRKINIKKQWKEYI